LTGQGMSDGSAARVTLEISSKIPANAQAHLHRVISPDARDADASKLAQLVPDILSTAPVVIRSDRSLRDCELACFARAR